jgi:hypothetical protein
MDEDPSRNFPKLIVYGCLSPPQILSPNIPNQPHGIRAVESGAISLQSLASGGAVSPRFVGAALFLGVFLGVVAAAALCCVCRSAADEHHCSRVCLITCLELSATELQTPR